MGGHARLVPWQTPTLDGNLSQMTQFAREIFDVNARAAINVGWVLASKQRNPVPVRRSYPGIAI